MYFGGEEVVVGTKRGRPRRALWLWVGDLRLLWSAWGPAAAVSGLTDGWDAGKG